MRIIMCRKAVLWLRSGMRCSADGRSRFGQLILEPARVSCELSRSVAVPN